MSNTGSFNFGGTPTPTQDEGWDNAHGIPITDAGAAAGPPPTFGGQWGQSTNAANFYAGQAANQQGTAAPTLDTTYSAPAAANASADYATDQQAIDLLKAQANGTAPNPAADQARQGYAAAVANQSALARSAGFGSKGAAAQRDQSMNNAVAGINATNTATVAGQQQQQQAQQQLAQATAQQSGVAQGLQGAYQSNAAGVGQLGLNQEGINNQQTEGYQNLAQSTMNAELGANTSNYISANNSDTAQAAAENAAANAWKTELTGAGIGAGAGLLMAADVKLREPGGTSGFTIREEPSFLLVRNDRTGELRKLATDPLTHEEHRQALAPHGAGPIHSYSDMPVGSPPASPPASPPMSSAPWAPQMTLGPRGVATPMPMARTKQTAMAPMQPRTMTFADLSIGNPSSTRIGPPGMRGGDEATHFMQTMGGPQPQPQSTMQRPLPGPAMQTPSVASRPAMPMTGAQALAAMPAGETRLQQILAAQKGGA